MASFAISKSVNDDCVKTFKQAADYLQHTIDYFDKHFHFEDNMYKAFKPFSLTEKMCSSWKFFEVTSRYKLSVDKDLILEECMILNTFLKVEENFFQLKSHKKWVFFFVAVKTERISSKLGASSFYTIPNSNAAPERIFNLRETVGELRETTCQ